MQKKGFERDTLVKRCPKCGELSLVIDLEKGLVKCTKCNYEVKLQKWQT